MTKYMVVSRKHGINERTLKILNEVVERVKNFKYLDVLINDQWNTPKEIKCRVEIARDVFLNIKTHLQTTIQVSQRK